MRTLCDFRQAADVIRRHSRRIKSVPDTGFVANTARRSNLGVSATDEAEFYLLGSMRSWARKSQKMTF